MALGLAEGGVALAVVVRSEAQLAETADRIRQLDGTALVIPAELGDLSQVTRALQRNG
jgi:short-subunit dehydrogenase